MYSVVWVFIIITMGNDFPIIITLFQLFVLAVNSVVWEFIICSPLGDTLRMSHVRFSMWATAPSAALQFCYYLFWCLRVCVFGLLVCVCVCVLVCGFVVFSFFFEYVFLCVPVYASEC